MARASSVTRIVEGDGEVQLVITRADSNQTYVISLSPADARGLGDALFKAACNVQPRAS